MNRKAHSLGFSELQMGKEIEKSGVKLSWKEGRNAGKVFQDLVLFLVYSTLI